MLNKLKEFFASELELDSPETQQEKLHEACAALLIEVSLADQDQSESEVAAVRTLLRSHLGLRDEKLEELMQYALENGKEQTSVHPFTSLINEHYSYEQKVTLVELMWKVAYADNNLDKYEDSIIRKVADLLYISHHDFIQTKLKTTGE